MNEYLWQYVMKINPFTKEEEVESIEELTPWDILITYCDGSKKTFDITTDCYQDVFYGDVDEITEEQERRYFSYRLRSMMSRNGYTQEQLANELNMTQSMVSRYIKGHAIPSVMIVRKIAKIFKCSMDDFFYRNY